MTTHNNVADFTAYKMRSLIARLDKLGDTDSAYALQGALDAYLLGDVDIDFIDGWPHILDIIEDINL